MELKLITQSSLDRAKPLDRSLMKIYATYNLETLHFQIEFCPTPRQIHVVAVLVCAPPLTIHQKNKELKPNIVRLYSTESHLSLPSSSITSQKQNQNNLIRSNQIISSSANKNIIQINKIHYREHSNRNQ